MRFPTHKQVEEMRALYPKGTRIELVKMDDVQAPPVGTRGTVLCVDDTGSLIVDWDGNNGTAFPAKSSAESAVQPSKDAPTTIQTTLPGSATRT